MGTLPQPFAGIMAEQFVSVLVENIMRELNSSVLQKSSFRDELTIIMGILSTMKPFLLDAEKKQQSNGAIRRWLEAATDAIYDLDELLATAPKVCISLFSSGTGMGHNIKKMIERLDYLALEGVRFKLDDHQKGLLYPKISVAAALPRSLDLFIGKEEDKESVIKLLMESNADDHVQVISIVGMGGMGKTTLARFVYNDERVARHFDVRAWVSAYEICHEELLMKRIIQSVRNYTSYYGVGRYDDMKEAIAGKKFLIVLDGVWETIPLLRSLIMDIGGLKGSRVLLTTRDVLLAESLCTVQPFVLRGLDEENSWSLFKLVAFQQGQKPLDSGIVDIGKDIVKKCGGIPLVIKTIGSLLYFQNSAYEWLELDRELTKLTHNKEFDVLSILELTYLHLPSHLKPCFSYFSLFQRDYRYDVNTLIKLWMAEGFVDPVDCSRMEDVGQGYVMELFWRSFFLEEQEDEWGSISSFKLHDLVHDLAMLVAGGKKKSVDSDVKDVSKTVRHVSLNFGSYFMRQIHTRIPELHKLRTLLNSQPWLPFKHNSNKDILSSIIQGFKGCKSLRVLGLQNLGMKKVPSYIGDLVQLRYLDLSENWMIRIPHSITKLLHLQTLKLSDCRFLKELPRGIGKMVNLRHLELDGCIDLQNMHSGLGQLISLQVLSQFVVTKLGCNPMSWCGSKLQELGKLNNLSGNLEILQLEHACLEEAKRARLEEKPLLRLLTLRWRRINDDCAGIHKDDKVLEYLSPHINLKALSITGYRGLGFPTWCSSLTNLVDITFLDCPRCRCLLPLHLLPSLKNLKLGELDSLEYISNGDVEDFMTKAPFFPSLKKLTVVDCRNFRCWFKRNTINSDAVRSFHCLSKLDIRYCPKLTSIPLFPTLDEELILSRVTAKLMQETMMMTTTTINMTALEAPAKMDVPTNSSSTFFSTPFPAALSKLKSLHIEFLEDLETLPHEWLRNLTSLQSLKISYCEKLKSISQGIQYLSSLVCFEIEYCQELDLCATEEDSMGWQFLKNLRSLTIRGLPELKSLPSGLQYVTSLQFLQLFFCDDVAALPEWIGFLSSLNWIGISGCDSLASLPHGMCSLTSLHTLTILDCPLLLPRCQPKTGEDWLKIAHVPNFSCETSNY